MQRSSAPHARLALHLTDQSPLHPSPTTGVESENLNTSKNKKQQTDSCSTAKSRISQCISVLCSESDLQTIDVSCVAAIFAAEAAVTILRTPSMWPRSNDVGIFAQPQGHRNPWPLLGGSCHPTNRDIWWMSWISYHLSCSKCMSKICIQKIYFQNVRNINPKKLQSTCLSQAPGVESWPTWTLCP